VELDRMAGCIPHCAWDIYCAPYRFRISPMRGFSQQVEVKMLNDPMIRGFLQSPKNRNIYI